MPQSVASKRMLSWLCVAVLFLAGGRPALGATPVGTLRPDGNVYLGNQTVRAASVIYSGDRLTTEEGRATVSFLSNALMVLDGHSDAALEATADGLRVGLEKGQLALAVPTARPIQVDTGGLSLTPVEAFPSLAEVALRADGSVVVAVHQGKVSVNNLRANPVFVSAGQILTVSPRVNRSQGQGKEPVGTGAHGKMTIGEKLRTFRIDGLSHTTSVAIVIVGLGAVATAAIVVPIAIRNKPLSPSVP